MGVIDTVFHRYLRIPYNLHVYRESTVPKSRATLVFLHGIGNSGVTWDEVSQKLPDDVNLVVVDLLGFGDSPKPSWATYSAKTQARSLAKTLLSIGLQRRIILVGHSMGSLVAVEFAKRYPALVKSLVLCSPPFYNLDPNDSKKLFVERDEQLRRVYELALKKPENIIKLGQLAKRYGLMNPGFTIDEQSLEHYIMSMRANILHQTALHDVVRIKRPIKILYGTLDPLVIGSNFKRASDTSSYITVTKFIGGHEIIGGYVGRVAKAINTQIQEVG